MPSSQISVGRLVRASRDILLNKQNTHVVVLSSAAPTVLKKGTEAEITAVLPNHIELNCKDGLGSGASAWGLKIRVAKVVFGISFE